MEVHLPSPQIVLWIAVAGPALVALFVLPRTKLPLISRIVPVAVAVLASVLLAVSASTPRWIAWDAQGIRDNTFGRLETIPWGEALEPLIVRDFWRSPYRPAVRTGGASYDRFRAGQFSLANGESARVYLETPSREALVFRRAGVLHVYAPAHVDDLVQTATAHCPGLRAP